MASGEKTESKRMVACNTARAAAYLVAHATRAAAYDLAVVTAKEVQNAADAAAIVAESLTDPAATPAVATAAAHKVEVARINAFFTAKYMADRAYNLANAVYKAAIEKADAEYVESLRIK